MGDIQLAPPPWPKLKGTFYMIPWWEPSAENKTLPSFAYSPLEAASDFAGPAGGRPVGGFASIAIVRYSETPVGPYDELMIAPGEHEYEVEGEDGKRRTRRNARITRIYVSQHHTCYNGRKNWNIPKHLAKFDFEESPQGTTVTVYPHDTTGDPTESTPSPLPLFRTTFKTQRLVPAFPLDTGFAKYVGLDPRLCQPPVPAGEGSLGEVPGTDVWCSTMSRMASMRSHAGWFDMRQPEAREEGVGEHFWPGFKRYQFGVRMDLCNMSLEDEAYWSPPKTRL